METNTQINLLSYDKIIIAFSGGKDCTASFLHLLESGVPVEKIELWHHDVDGKGKIFMDWEVTAAYCRQFAKAFNVPIYFSWKQGGFKQEMLRNNTGTAPVVFEVPVAEWLINKGRKRADNSGYYVVGKTRPEPNTRLKFPQVSPDLMVRWCSSYLKIDVCSAAIRNQERFKNKRILVVSGERGEESPARSKYAEFEPDRADLRNGKKFFRHVDRYRPVKDWLENRVWAIIERWKVRVHPAYYLGWGRVSCKYCIFGNANQFASAYLLSPTQGDEIMYYEDSFGCTIG